MILQLLFTLCIMMTTIQTVIDLRDKEMRNNRDSIIYFPVNPEHLRGNQCPASYEKSRGEYFLSATCPPAYDPICNDPVFDSSGEFELRCRFPMKANSVLSMNSTSFLELMKMRDPYGRDWCMIVMFYAASCPFSARLAPNFNSLAGKFENILPVAVDASDFTKSYRLNFRYGISGTPTVLLWVNGIAVARMGNKDVELSSLKSVIAAHTDLVEKDDENRLESIPDTFFNVGAELKNVSIDPDNNALMEMLYTFACFFVCILTVIYHLREKILLYPPVLAWFQSKCGGPLCDDIYFLFYVVPPRLQRAPPAEPPAPAPEPAPEEAPNEEVIELPPLVIDNQ